MQTIKTGVVVALLLAVCYGAFVALNAPEPALPDELLSEFDWSPEEAGLENYPAPWPTSTKPSKWDPARSRDSIGCSALRCGCC